LHKYQQRKNMKTLYLLRHAKAESEGSSPKDIDRKLCERGRLACELIGERILQKQYIPQFVICSPSARTKETFELVSQAANLQIDCEFIKDLYLADSEDIIENISSVSDDYSSLAVIGHNPGMHIAAVSLVKDDDSELNHQLALKYPTGTLTVLQFDCDSWQDVRAGQGNLIDFITPVSE